MTHVLVALTGASGALYGVRLVHRLIDADVRTDVVVSKRARLVLALEHDLRGDPLVYLTSPSGGAPRLLDDADMASAPASGSTAPDAMIVSPCTMGTLARIAAGLSGTLIERVADVMLKEHRRLVLVPRESPLSSLHLRNMLTLSELGVRIVPAMPAFYSRPENIDDMIAFVVDRALRAAGLDVPLRTAWEPPEEKGSSA